MKTFLAMLRRDVHVARREIVLFLVRTALQPILFVVVFGTLLPAIGYTQRGYAAALLPGIVGISIALSAIQAVSLPLVQEFGWTREIEDRLLAPVATSVVAIEKIVAGTIQGFIAAAFVLPVARLIMGPIPGLTFRNAPGILAMALLGSAAFSALGLLIGTAIKPQQISFMFSLIIAPLIFFGCGYYPWRGLDRFPAMKWGVLVNPLVYVNEGMRSVLTPTIPHMPAGAVVVALALITALFTWLGVRAFERRAIG